MKNIIFLIAAVILFSSIAGATPLTDWQAHMTSFGATHCATLNETINDDPHLLATYYDAERVYFQIRDYTGDTSWNSCAQAAEYHYRDLYLIPNGGVLPGYWVFGQGLQLDYNRNGDVTSKSALDLLGTASTWCNGSAYSLANLPAVEQIRENAYCLMTALERKKVGESLDPLTAQYVNNAISHLTIMFVSHTASSTKPFMVGLASEALIQYYTEITPDSRIIPILTTTANGLWSGFWDVPSQSFFYVDNPLPGDEGHNPAPDLNLLIAPLYSWLAWKSSDGALLAKYDQVFAGGVAGAYLANPKQFNQNYRWSFKGVEWHDLALGATPTPTPTPTPTATPSGTPTKTPTPTPTPCPLTQSLAGHQCRINRLETLVCGSHPC